MYPPRAADEPLENNAEYDFTGRRSGVFLQRGDNSVVLAPSSWCWSVSRSLVKALPTVLGPTVGSFVTRPALYMHCESAPKTNSFHEETERG